MWASEFSMETETSAAKIWQLWTDVANWKRWDDSVEYSNIDGKFENGTFGILKPVNGPKSKFCLKDVAVHKSFTSQSKLPLCTIDFVHELENDSNVLKIKHRIKMTGPLTFIFKNIIGTTIAKRLPVAVKKIVEMAQ